MAHSPSTPQALTSLLGNIPGLSLDLVQALIGAGSSQSSSVGPSSQPNHVLSRSPSPDPPLVNYPRSAIQPTPDDLSNLGIKVRDFAYESKLPPIPPIRFLTRQVQPGPRPLKRRRYSEEYNSALPPQIAKAPKDTDGSAPERLRRKSTEPIEEPTESAKGGLQRENAGTLSYVGDEWTFSQSQSQSQPQSQPFRPYPQSQPYPYSQSQSQSQDPPPSLFMDSQESDYRVDTPLITPEASLADVDENLPPSTSPVESSQPSDNAEPNGKGKLREVALPAFSNSTPSPVSSSSPPVVPTHEVNDIDSASSSEEPADRAIQGKRYNLRQRHPLPVQQAQKRQPKRNRAPSKALAMDSATVANPTRKQPSRKGRKT